MTAFVTAQPTALKEVDRLRNLLCGEDGSEGAGGLSACLPRLLGALGWRGDPRLIAEALPHFATELSLADVRDMLARLGYITAARKIRLADLDPRLAPFLFLPRKGAPMVVYGAADSAAEGGLADGGLAVFDGGAGRDRTLTGPELRALRGTAYLPRKAAEESAQPAGRTDWFRQTVARFRRTIALALGVSFLINILALIVPLSIMAIYDQVVGRQATDMLAYILAGVAAVALAEWALRRLRARAQAHVAARMDYLISSRAFEHVLALPLSSTERAPIGGQVARLREMESLRDLFTSPLAGVILDLPFVVVFLAVIGLLAGWLVLVPALMVLAFVLLGLLVFPALRRRVSAAGAARAERQTFLVELLSTMRTVRQAGAEDVWAERYRSLSADAAVAGFRVASASAILQDIAQLLMTAAGAAVLVLGAQHVMAGELSLGALIAAMALTWRVLSPLQTGFTQAGNLKQIGRGIATLNQLLGLKGELGDGRPPLGKTMFSGRLQFRRVILRHSPQADPALFDVNLSIEPGEVIAVAGASGSGKSSLLKVTLGLYAPQAGTVLLDGIDVRQIDPAELRQAISYVPQNSAEFYGTLGQNLQLANPVATADEVAEACRLAGLSEDIQRLPDGLDTRIGDHAARTLPPGLSQRLALARAFLRPAPIMLLDEPGNALDAVGDRAFVRAVEAARGRRTVILVTHRPSHMRLADRVVVLERGQVVAAGGPEEVIPRILDA